jgi:hypothetical protein
MSVSLFPLYWFATQLVVCTCGTIRGNGGVSWQISPQDVKFGGLSPMEDSRLLTILYQGCVLNSLIYYIYSICGFCSHEESPTAVFVDVLDA